MAPTPLVDRRLLTRVRLTRRYLVAATITGLVATAAVLVQAVLLASVISSSVLHHTGWRPLLPQLLGLGGAFLGRAAVVWAGEVAAQRTGASITSELRTQLLARCLQRGPTWLTGERSGELSVTATRGIRALDQYFGRYVPQALLAALTPVVVLAWMAAVDWPSALVLVGVVAGIPVAMTYFGRKAAAENERQWRRLTSLAARFLELVQGLPTLRALGVARRGRQEVAAATESLRQSVVRTLRVGFLSALVLDLLAGLGVGLVAMVLGLRLLGGDLPLGTALAVLLVAPEVLAPLRRAAAEFHANAEGKEAAGRVLDVLETLAPADHLSARDDGAGRSDGDAGRRLFADPAVAAIRLSGVSVHYPGRRSPALDELDLELRPGEHLLLTGPSGAGKSTLVALLLRFVAWDAGSVEVGGIDLSTVDPDRWREQLAWVPQRPHLLRGSIGDNLRLGRPDATAPELSGAVEAVGLDELVGRLPLGLGTPVGEGGFELSAGERHRVALGRALLRTAPVVLLDEPGAHLDTDDLSELRERLQPWLEDRTVLVTGEGNERLTHVDRRVAL